MSAWGGAANLGPPTIGGFENFLYNVVAVPAAALPTGSLGTTIAYGMAFDLIPCELNIISPDAYTICVYNLALDNLITFVGDQPGQNYFVNLRQQYGLVKFQPGVVQSTSDDSTSTSLMVPDVFKDMSLSDLQYLKTPYGRLVMSYLMKLGPAWGMS
jgi:hypothetical protein